MATDTGHGLLDMVNVRDLGGLPTTEGGTTRRELLYRSESLAAVTDRDRLTLVERLGVSNVIDLRAAIEVEHKRPTWAQQPGMTYLNLPMSDGFDTVPSSLTDQELADLVPSKYLRYLEFAGGNIITALGSIADAASAGRATIFACTFGKDRTGVLAMLVLDLIGVERASVIDDYVASAAAMPQLLERIKDDPMHGPRVALVPAQVYQANKYSAEAFLRGLDERGGAEAWAIAAGFPRSDIDRLRTALITT